MRILIAGATGAIGKPIAQNAVNQGHAVFALTRKKQPNAEGISYVQADIFDEKSVLEAFNTIKPEVVVNVLTSLPKTYTPESMRKASPEDARIRKVGHTHLLSAALATGAKRYLLQSASFWYSPGEGLADETVSFAFNASPGIAAGTKLLYELEQSALNEIESVILRYGFFYGPRTWFEPAGDMAEQARQKELPCIKDANGLWNFVHVNDAAAATVAAFDGPSGVYNLNDNTPIEINHWLPEFAKWLNAPPPPMMSQEEYLQLKGADSLYYATKLRGANNAKAKKLLHFQPRPLEWSRKHDSKL